MSDIETVRQDDIVILNLKGRVDATNSGQVHDKVMEEIKNGCSDMIINFVDVNYISSAGLRVLIFATKSFAKSSGSFSVCSLNENIMKIFEISGLMNLFTIHADLETGLNSLKS